MFRIHSLVKGRKNNKPRKLSVAKDWYRKHLIPLCRPSSVVAFALSNSLVISYLRAVLDLLHILQLAHFLSKPS